MNNFIITGRDSGFIIKLAAKELRRYLYVLEGDLPQILSEHTVIGTKLILALSESPLIDMYRQSLDINRLNQDGYMIKSLSSSTENTIVFTGHNEISVLYAVYHFFELQGVRFYLHGDIIPDKKTSSSVFDVNYDIIENPLFELRGILPFHDFPEGPDWWNKQDYLAILTQLPKLRANFIGFHTYPELDMPDLFTAEPLVWIGVEDDFDEAGNVTASYPAQHFRTNGDTWGYHSMLTSDYPYGLGNFFDRDSYGADYMKGYEEGTYTDELRTGSTEKYNTMFNAFGDLLKEAFEYAQALDIKVCVGTESPLTIPRAVKARLGIEGDVDQNTVTKLYKGIFERINRKYPIDYYWLWTPERWTLLGNTPEETKHMLDDFNCALKGKAQTGAGYELALCGWTLGPQEDRAGFDNHLPDTMPFSCINRVVGYTPVEESFRDIKDRPKWAIPWLEDDSALVSPQLWVGRMRRDAYDARRYGCTGLMGIHWRTRVIAPNVYSLMKAAWNQKDWTDGLEDIITFEGWMGESRQVCRQEASGDISGKTGDIYSTAREGLDGYSLLIPGGTYSVHLHFCDFLSTAEGQRVFDVSVGYNVKKGIDLFAFNGNEPWTFTFDNIGVRPGASLNIKFRGITGKTIISGISIDGYIDGTMTGNLDDESYIRKINCAGPALSDFEVDLDKFDPNGRYAPVRDFYLDWAQGEFGEEVSEKAGEIFTAIDGNLPRPSRWEKGPGGLYRNPVLWDIIEEEYRFVGELLELKPLVCGGGNRRRFDYWCGVFEHMRASAKTGCLWGAFERAYKEADPYKMQETYGLLIQSICELEKHSITCLETNGDLGVLTNIQQHSIVPILKDCGAKLAEFGLMAEELPALDMAECTRIIVPTKRTSISHSENFVLKIIVPGGNVSFAVLHWRPLGETMYRETSFKNTARWIYEARIPKDQLADDFEYFIFAETSVKKLRYPICDLCPSQTVIVL